MKIRKRMRRLANGVKTLWECDLGRINGKRVAYCYRTEKEAVARLEKEQATVKQFGLDALSLSEAERRRFIAARDRLEKLGATIEEAVEYYAREHRPLKGPITLGKLLDACVLAKELDGRRAHYVRQFGVSCRSFVLPRREQLVHTVRRAEVAEWVRGNGWAPKTERVYLGDLRALFSFALDAEYISKNPAAGRFQLSSVMPAEIEALTAEQAGRLLTLAASFARPAARGRWREWERPPLLWYVVLGLFCGIRPAELERMDRSAVNLEERHVVVTGRSAKTRQRRVVDLSDNAVAWLSLDPLRAGPVCSANFTLLWARLRVAAGFRAHVDGRARTKAKMSPGLLKWPHDAMRHTFASMHYAMHQNESLLKAQMGHSKAEDTLMQHYRALKTRREAETFWALIPAAPRRSRRGIAK